MTVRVVQGLPYGLIAGPAFLWQNDSMIIFADGGCFRPTPGSPRVSFVTEGNQQVGEGRTNAPSWHAALELRRERKPGRRSRRRQNPQRKRWLSGSIFVPSNRTTQSGNNRALRLHLPYRFWETTSGKTTAPYRGNYFQERLRQRTDRSVCRGPATARKAVSTGYTGRPVRLGVRRRLGGSERHLMVAPFHIPSMRTHQCHKGTDNLAKGDRSDQHIRYERQRRGTNAATGGTANPGPRAGTSTPGP